MGLTQFAPVRLADRLTDVRDVPAPDIASVLSLRPETALSRQALVQAQSHLRLQRVAWIPDPEAFFGYKRATGFNTFVGGVNISLPLLNRNQGLISSAQAEIRLAESQQRATEAQIRAEVEAAWNTYVSRRTLLTETLAPMRERAEEISRIALAAYREGGIDLLRLLDAERARLEAMTAYYQALADYQTSVTHVQIVTGGPL
jgi:outer membrane protein TolC